MQRKRAVILTLLAMAAAAPMLSACYTAEGAGKDLQAAGQGLQNSAQHNAKYSP